MKKLFLSTYSLLLATSFLYVLKIISRIRLQPPQVNETYQLGLPLSYYIEHGGFTGLITFHIIPFLFDLLFLYIIIFFVLKTYFKQHKKLEKYLKSKILLYSSVVIVVFLFYLLLYSHYSYFNSPYSLLRIRLFY